MIGEVNWAWFCNWVFNVSSSQGISLHQRCKSSSKLPLLTFDLCPRFDRSSSWPLSDVLLSNVKTGILWLHVKARNYVGRTCDVHHPWRWLSMRISSASGGTPATLSSSISAGFFQLKNVKVIIILQKRGTRIASSNLSRYWVVQHIAWTTLAGNLRWIFHSQSFVGCIREEPVAEAHDLWLALIRVLRYHLFVMARSGLHRYFDSLIRGGFRLFNKLNFNCLHAMGLYIRTGTKCRVVLVYRYTEGLAIVLPFFTNLV